MNCTPKVLCLTFGVQFIMGVRDLSTIIVVVILNNYSCF